MNRAQRDAIRRNRIKTKTPRFAVQAAERATADALAKRSRYAGTVDVAEEQPETVQPPIDRRPQRDLTNEEFEQLTARLERRLNRENERAAGKQAHDELQARWSHKAGTPETHERIEIIPSRRRQHPLERMHQQGKVSDDEIHAAWQIQRVVENIERAVSISSASLEARVDCSGSARDILVESLSRVREEVAYGIWRKRLGNAAPLVLQMVCSSLSYVRVAKMYGLPYRDARSSLISALRLWTTLFEDVCKTVDRDEIAAAHARLGEGYVVAPRPRKPKATDVGHQDA